MLIVITSEKYGRLNTKKTFFVKVLNAKLLQKQSATKNSNLKL